MAAPRFVFLASATVVLLVALSGCVGPTSPVAAISHRGSSDVFPWSDPDPVPGAIEGEVRRGAQLPADEQGLDTTRPWPGVVVVIRNPAGVVVAAPVSDGQGRFRVTLAPGDYVLSPVWPTTELHPISIAPKGTGVTVASNAVASVRLVYDPGIF